MKHTLIALAMGLASTAAFANTGNINFHGTITPGGTCPIEVVMPGTGGSIPVSYTHLRANETS